MRAPVCVQDDAVQSFVLGDQVDHEMFDGRQSDGQDGGHRVGHHQEGAYGLTTN